MLKFSKFQVTLKEPGPTTKLNSNELAQYLDGWLFRKNRSAKQPVFLIKQFMFEIHKIIQPNLVLTLGEALGVYRLLGL